MNKKLLYLAVATSAPALWADNQLPMLNHALAQLGNLNASISQPNDQAKTTAGGVDIDAIMTGIAAAQALGAYKDICLKDSKGTPTQQCTPCSKVNPQQACAQGSLQSIKDARTNGNQPATDTTCIQNTLQILECAILNIAEQNRQATAQTSKNAQSAKKIQNAVKELAKMQNQSNKS